MSTQSTHNSPSATEAKCPDCGTTLSRQSDLKRHRKTQHPDGTEVKAHCPYAGCEYKTDQRSNLMAHMNARHSNESRYPCPDCGKGFTDPAARIRHRKTTHGYQPYHTPRYYARRALKEAEQRAKAALKKTGDQKAANAFPPSTQSVSSSSSSSVESLSDLLANATYHNDFWKILIDFPHRDASEPKVSQDAQISAPVAVAPACDTPKTLRSDSDLSSLKVGQQPVTGDGAYSCGSQLDTTMQPQSLALAPSWDAYGYTTPGAASVHRPFPATFPTLGGQSTYQGMGFQSLPTFSFANIPSPVPNSFISPTTSTSSSSSRTLGPQFISPNYLATPPPLESVPALSWTPSFSPAISTPMTQTEFFTGEPNRGFNTWYQSHDFA
ncbi:hypothetical protein V8E53_002709 [Lactarius tabidus]